jgi:parvulin-like peptidyl-prolyl isomerase
VASSAPQLETVAFALPNGAVSDPIDYRRRLRILRAAEHAEAGLTPFEEVRADITKRLIQERSAKGYEEYMEACARRRRATPWCARSPCS